MGLLCREHLQLPLRSGRVAAGSVGRRVAARAEEMRRLMIESKRLHRGDERSATAPRNQQRLLTHLARECTRQWMPKEIQNSLGVARQQRRAQTVQKRQHRDSAVFGVIYTL
jgi:hypothetical protein